MNKQQEQAWQGFAERAKLSDEQLNQFQRYYELLIRANELFNLTAITQVTSIIYYHFEDSLALAGCKSLETVQTIADIGSGAGFPGIPLKIMYPHLSVILIEVTYKKRAFLEDSIAELGLSGVEVYPLDWRTFLRKADYAVDLFCARASLQFRELLRLFRPASRYRNAQLAYWASAPWVPEDFVVPFIKRECLYQVGHRKRKIVLLESTL